MPAVQLEGFGGGGAGLNFKVVGGATQPASATENTIWVNTDTAITSYVFSVTEPTGIPGLVWITTGATGSVEFNAIKKNYIQIYPISAKQYISGAWVDKTAKSYQNGEWVDWWTGGLYDMGDEFTSVTGGWEVVALPWNTSTDAKRLHTLTKGESNMTAKTTGNGGSAIRTVNAINLTGYTKLKANVKTSKADSNTFRTMRVWKANQSYLHTPDSEAYVSMPTTQSDIEIDIGTLDGLHRIGFCLYVANGDTATYTINKVWLER